MQRACLSSRADGPGGGREPTRRRASALQTPRRLYSRHHGVQARPTDISEAVTRCCGSCRRPGLHLRGGGPGRGSRRVTRRRAARDPPITRARRLPARVHRGRSCPQISFPLGGVGAGSIGLGGRGQLRDWQIFNRPDRGNAPGYAFPAIRVDRGPRAPFVSVLEGRLRPPYQGPFGLGSRSAPGLQRLESSRFTGEFPLAQVAFRDRRLPVRVTLDAFSPVHPARRR